MKNNRNFGAFSPIEYVYYADEKEYWRRNHFRVSWYWDETNVKQVLSTTIGRRRKRHKSCSIAKYVTILGTLFEKTIKGTQRVLGDGYWDKLFSKFRASRFISERRISSIFMLIFLTRRRSFCGSQQPFFKWSVISWMQKKELHGNKSTKYYKSCSHFEF